MGRIIVVIMGIIMMIISLIMITTTITITTARIIIITITTATPATYHMCTKSNKTMRHNKSSNIISQSKTINVTTITLTK